MYLDEQKLWIYRNSHFLFGRRESTIDFKTQRKRCTAKEIKRKRRGKRGRGKDEMGDSERLSRENNKENWAKVLASPSYRVQMNWSASWHNFRGAREGTAWCDMLIYGDVLLFLFFQVIAWHHRIRTSVFWLCRIHWRVRKLAGYDLLFCSWPGNSCGR